MPTPGPGCGIDWDQADAFMPRLNVRDKPAQVLVDSRFREEGDFMATAVIAAIERWNSFSRATLGRRLFEVREANLSDSQSVPSARDECGFDGSTETSFRIVREESMTRWRALGLTNENGRSSVPGVTLRCAIGRRLDKQVILLNTRPQVMRSSQLMSVALHELGHAIGLDHSCQEGAGTARYRSCKGLGTDHPYFVAVMYPVFRVSSRDDSGTDIKQALRTNDMLRAQCLYNGQ